MPERVATQVAAIRRQIRRTQSVQALGAVLAIGSIAVLTAAPLEDWFNSVVFLAICGYAVRKGILMYRAWRARQQLRLEEQFVRHGPASEQVLTCLRSAHHLWHSSLILKTLKELRRRPDGMPRSSEDPAVLARTYRRAFRRLRPSRWPVDGIAMTGLFLGWLWRVPEDQVFTTSVLLGAVLLLTLSGAEVVLAVLHAGLRRAYDDWTGLLVDWTLANVLNDVLPSGPKPYRHTPLYHATAPQPYPRPSGGDGHTGTPIFQENDS